MAPCSLLHERAGQAQPINEEFADNFKLLQLCKKFFSISPENIISKTENLPWQKSSVHISFENYG